jgi:hypothetical protein
MYSSVDRDVRLCGGVWGDGEALNMKWHWLTVGCCDRWHWLTVGSCDRWHCGELRQVALWGVATGGTG